MDTYTATGAVPLDRNVHVTVDPSTDATAVHGALDRVVNDYQSCGCATPRATGGTSEPASTSSSC